jgi:hypothetical protein
MSFAVVDLDDELARKLRDAVHKEATNLSDSGSPNAVTEFLKTLCATYGVKPDKVCARSIADIEEVGLGVGGESRPSGPLLLRSYRTHPTASITC